MMIQKGKGVFPNQSHVFFCLIRFDEAFIYAAADRVNEVFGGLNPNVNNTINIHGYIDPWRALGVYMEDLKEGSPTHTVPR
jgi:hypothetical protein